VLDRDRRDLSLEYAPEASRGGEGGSEVGREVVLGISPCKPGQAGEMPSLDGLRQ
jgi:hypothetical protein